MSFSQLTTLMNLKLEKAFAEKIVDENELYWAKLLEFQKSISTDSIRVAFVGLFSSGKSTLMNAILGYDILPRKVLPTTGVVTCVTYSEILSANVVKNDGTETQINFDGNLESFSEQLESTIQIQWDENANAINTDTDLIYVKSPVSLFEYGYELVDTPGLHDANAEMTSRTFNQLLNTDMVILVFNNALGVQERELISLIKKQLSGNIVFLYNHNPLLHDEDEMYEILDWVRNEIDDSVSPDLGVHIFSVRALDALRFRTGEESADTISAHKQLTDFESFLTGFAQDGKHLTTALSSRVNVLKNQLKGMKEIYEEQVESSSVQLKQMNSKEKLQHEEILKKFDEHVEKATLDLQRLKVNLNNFGESMIASAVTSAKSKMDRDSEWHNSLSGVLDYPINTFVSQVNDNVQKAIDKFDLKTNTFAYKRTATISAGENPGADAGTVVGGVIGLFGGPVTAGVGAFVGRGVGKWLGNDKWKESAISNVRSASQTERLSIVSSATTHIDVVIENLGKYTTVNRPAYKPTRSITNLQSKLAKIHHKIEWIDVFLCELDNVMESK